MDEILESVSLPPMQMGRFAEPRVVLEGNSLMGTITLPGGGTGVYTVISADTAWALRSSLGSGIGCTLEGGFTSIVCSRDPRAGMIWVNDWVKDA